MRSRFAIQSPGPNPASVAASPLSSTCIFGVLTRRFPTLRCQGRRRRTRKSLSSTAMYSRTVVRSSPNSPAVAHERESGGESPFG